MRGRPYLPAPRAPHPPAPSTHEAPQAGAQLREGAGPSRGSRVHGGLGAPRVRRPAEAGQQPRGAAHGVVARPRRLLVPREAGGRQQQAQRQGGGHQHREPGHGDAGRGWRRAAGRETAAPAPYICGWAGRGARADAGTQGPPHPRGRSPMGSAPLGHRGALEEQMVESLVVMRRPLLPHPGPPPRF